MLFYTGVGSREAPMEVQLLAERAACVLAATHRPRTGGAPGMDYRFMRGTSLYSPQALAESEIYLPWDGFEGYWAAYERGFYVPQYWWNWNEALAAAASIHPTWDDLTHGMKLLHARNIYQVLGPYLNQPSAFILYYAKPSGKTVLGGTRTAVELARRHRVPDLNLFYPDVCENLDLMLQRNSVDILSLCSV